MLVLVLVVAVAFTLSCGSPSGGEFGGPYPIRADKKNSKLAEFDTYDRANLFQSEATVLTWDLFVSSLKDNLDFPHGAIQQKYSYVIMPEANLDIVVSTWKDRIDLTSLVTGGADPCQDGMDFMIFRPRGMINWFPETQNKSMCWLDRSLHRGLLDALSKHFMLTQGQGKSIEDYKTDSAQWLEAEVAYAGEIVVEVYRCRWQVNNESGTYMTSEEKRDKVYLGVVAEHFKAKLGKKPGYGSKGGDKISGVPPVCP